MFKFVLLKWDVDWLHTAQIDVDWLHMAQIKDWWQAVLPTVMNFKFPKTARCVFIPEQVSACHAGPELDLFYTLSEPTSH
jgi:hypothetical protein